MAISPIGDGGGDYTGRWTEQSDYLVNQYIQDALNRHGGDVPAAAEDLRLQRQDPHNFYDTNLAMAEDYLYARGDAGHAWDGGNVGTVGETAKINSYMFLKWISPGVEAANPFHWSPVSQRGAGPISPYSDKEKEWMLKGVQDAGRLDGAGPLPAARLTNEPPYYND
jgi:hypothetical protein